MYVLQIIISEIYRFYNHENANALMLIKYLLSCKCKCDVNYMKLTVSQ